METPAAKELLGHLFKVGVQAVHPTNCLAPHLPAAPKGRLIVLGAGKAAAHMAAAFEAAWQGQPPEGLVITRYGHCVPTKHIKVREAAHPVPDAAGVAATQELLGLAQSATADDLVVVLLSGGASALMVAPASGHTLESKQALIKQLLADGADITHINKARTELSAVKGGGLARAAAPAHVRTLAISDVVGDDPRIIGSGPSYVPGGDYKVIANGKRALDAIEEEARAKGLSVIRWGNELAGDAAAIAARHAKELPNLNISKPTLILSGGEFTLTLPNNPGFGGPSRHYALCLQQALRESPLTFNGLVADSDGSDGLDPPGTPSVAGGFIHSGDSADAAQAIANADSAAYFSSADANFTTGPTGTNVNDLRLLLLTP